MQIGFDAKRFYHNRTGLGNYSRTLINGLLQLYPDHRYFLFNPNPVTHFQTPRGATEVIPLRPLDKLLPALWRAVTVKQSMQQHHIELYHGLSNELPYGIEKTGVRTAVTVHDIIFERYPKQYGQYEVLMHRAKIKSACKRADVVIAASAQTKTDLAELYGVPQQKIKICYQSCHAAFSQNPSDEYLNNLRQQYNLPPQFFLYVGSINERKNLLRICQAMKAAGSKLHLPLVVVGSGKQYKNEVVHWVAQNNFTNRIIFLSDVKNVGSVFDINGPENLSALYHAAVALVYPSLFEGFGIPVLEALWAGLPVITSNVSSMPEIAGPAALYVNPEQQEEIGDAMEKMQNDSMLRKQLIAAGQIRAELFSLSRCTEAVMEVYSQLV